MNPSRNYPYRRDVRPPNAEGLGEHVDRELEKVEQAFTTLGLIRGDGTPEGHVSASVGTLYLRKDGGAGSTFYVKESGTGNTGWVAK